MLDAMRFCYVSNNGDCQVDFFRMCLFDTQPPPLLFVCPAGCQRTVGDDAMENLLGCFLGQASSSQLSGG